MQVALTQEIVRCKSREIRHDVSKRTRRPCHEDEQVYGRADRICPEASRAGYEGRGDLLQARDKRSDVLHIWTAPDSKRKLTDTEVDCVHISGVRAEPSAQLDIRACRPQQLEDLKGRHKNQVPCSPDRPECHSSIRQRIVGDIATLLSDTTGRLRASTRSHGPSCSRLQQWLGWRLVWLAEQEPMRASCHVCWGRFGVPHARHV